MGDVSGYAGTGIGNGLNGYVNGPAETAQFSGLRGIAVSSNGTVYVGDYVTNRIRKISPSGIVSTFAGSGVAGYADGLGEAAKFNGLGGIALDQQGNLYVSEYGNSRLRKITPDGLVTTLAGTGVPGTADGDVSSGQLDNPASVTVAPDGSVYVADRYRIRKVDRSGNLTTYAGGAGQSLGLEYSDGPKATATFNFIQDLASDSAGNLFVLEGLRLRKIDEFGNVSTVISDRYGSYQNLTFGPVTSSTPLGRGRSLDFDQQGNLYIETTAKVLVGAGVGEFIVKVTGLASPVQPVGTTTTALTSQTAPWSVGVPGTFTATTTSSVSGTPVSGTVELREGSTVLATQPVGPNGVTSFSVNLAIGPHTLSAAFLGTTNNSPSNSSPLIVEVFDPGFGLVSNFSLNLPIVYQSPLLQVAPGTVSNIASASSLRSLNNPDFPHAFQVTVARGSRCWTVPGTNPESMVTATAPDEVPTPADIKVAPCDATNQAQWFYLEHGSLSAEGTWQYELRPAWNITLWAQFDYFGTEKRCVKLAPNKLPAPAGSHPVLGVCALFGSDLSQFWSIGVGPPNVGNGKLPQFDGLNDTPARPYPATGKLTAISESQPIGEKITQCSATLTVLGAVSPAVPDLTKSFVSTAAHCVFTKSGVPPKDIAVTFTLSDSLGDEHLFCALFPDIRTGKFVSSLDTEEDYAFIKVSKECNPNGVLIPGGPEAYQLAQPVKYCGNCSTTDSVLRTASFPGDVPQLGQAESVRVAKETSTRFRTIAALEQGSSGGRIGTQNQIVGVLSAKDASYSGLTGSNQFDSSVKPIGGYRMVGPRFIFKRTKDLAVIVSNLRSSVK